MITAYNQYQVPVGFADKILFAQKSVTLSYYNYVKELMGKQENCKFGAIHVQILRIFKKKKLSETYV